MILILLSLAGPKLCIVVNDIDTAMEVLVKKGSDFAGRMSSPARKF